VEASPVRWHQGCSRTELAASEAVIIPALVALLIATALRPPLTRSHDLQHAKDGAMPSTSRSIAAAGSGSVAPRLSPPPRETPEVKNDDEILLELDSSLVRSDALVANRRRADVVRRRRR
jgi:hypothetical protein